MFCQTVWRQKTNTRVGKKGQHRKEEEDEYTYDQLCKREGGLVFGHPDSKGMRCLLCVVEIKLIPQDEVIN